jgi:hypothetical protein
MNPYVSQFYMYRIWMARHSSSEYRIKVWSVWDRPPRLVALAILGFWYQDRMGGLLEELGEPEKEMTRKAKGSQGNRGAKSLNFCCKRSYTIHTAIQDLTGTSS